jgi:hypothetical protein
VTQNCSSEDQAKKENPKKSQTKLGKEKYEEISLKMFG